MNGGIVLFQEQSFPDKSFEDAFQYTVVAKGHSRLKSTNGLERLNQEVRRREKVVHIFPNTDSAIRLIGAVLMDIHEKWIGSSRKYIKFQFIELRYPPQFNNQMSIN